MPAFTIIYVIILLRKKKKIFIVKLINMHINTQIFQFNLKLKNIKYQKKWQISLCYENVINFEA